MPKYTKGIGRPGRLRWPLEIQAATETVDSSGASIEDWSSPSGVVVTGETRGSIDALTGGETEQDNRRVADQLHMIVVRYQASGITVKNRLYDTANGRTFTIQAISVDNRTRRLMITCREVLNG